MSKIRGRGNAATELKLIQLFREHGVVGWRRHKVIKLMIDGVPFKVKPDFVFMTGKLAVFADGEFWHGHPTRANIPKNNRSFWLKKINGNRARDHLVNRVLKSRGWKVLRIWQGDILKANTLKRLFRALS